MQDLKSQIIQLSEYFKPESLAKTFKVPIELIHAVLNGEDIEIENQKKIQGQTVIQVKIAPEPSKNTAVDRDFLTGCFTRTMLEKYLNENNATYCVVFFDVDNFKLINDTYGHATGDKMLSHIGNFLIKSIRASDRAFRYGGDEFVLILPNTDLAGAQILVDKIYQCWLQKTFTEINDRGVTFSGGIAEYGVHGSTLEEVLDVADKTLYRVKRNGRGRIEPAHVGTIFKEDISHMQRKIDIGAINNSIIGLWGDNMQSVFDAIKNPKKTMVLFNANIENQSLAFKVGIDMELLWKHDWRLGLNATPFEINPRVHLYDIDYNQKDIKTRDYRAIGNLIKKHLENKNEQLVIIMGFNEKMKDIIEKSGGIIVGGDGH